MTINVNGKVDRTLHGGEAVQPACAGLPAMQMSIEIKLDKETFLQLEQQASEPYNRFAYRDHEQFDMIRRFLFERGLCEFCPPFGRVLIDDGRVVAMMACLSTEDLVRCRLLVALALSQLDSFRQDKALQQRLWLARRILIKPQPGDFYLARIAIVNSMRRRGIGRYLLGQCESEARKCGCRRVILEVDPGNDSAVSLYRKACLQDGAVCSVTDPETGRSLKYLHMAKTLQT